MEGSWSRFRAGHHDWDAIPLRPRLELARPIAVPTSCPAASTASAPAVRVRRVPPPGRVPCAVRPERREESSARAGRPRARPRRPSGPWSRIRPRRTPPCASGFFFASAGRRAESRQRAASPCLSHHLQAAARPGRAGQVARHPKMTPGSAAGPRWHGQAHGQGMAQTGQPGPCSRSSPSGRARSTANRNRWWAGTTTGLPSTSRAASPCRESARGRLRPRTGHGSHPDISWGLVPGREHRPCRAGRGSVMRPSLHGRVSEEGTALSRNFKGFFRQLRKLPPECSFAREAECGGPELSDGQSAVARGDAARRGRNAQIPGPRGASSRDALPARL